MSAEPGVVTGRPVLMASAMPVGLDGLDGLEGW
jgi:hypothetical protein